MITDDKKGTTEKHGHGPTTVPAKEEGNPSTFAPKIDNSTIVGDMKPDEKLRSVGPQEKKV